MLNHCFGVFSRGISLKATHIYPLSPPPNLNLAENTVGFIPLPCNSTGVGCGQTAQAGQSPTRPFRVVAFAALWHPLLPTL